MALNIFFSEDIRNALLAANEASASIVLVVSEVGLEDPKYLRAFREGYKAALVTVALAFGLPPQSIRPKAEGAALPRPAAAREP